MAKNEPKRPKNDPIWPKGKRASSSIMECEEFIPPDWSPPNDPARPCRPKGRQWPSGDNDDGDGDACMLNSAVQSI